MDVETNIIQLLALTSRVLLYANQHVDAKERLLASEIMTRSGKSKKKLDREDEVPDVFKDMLADATRSTPSFIDDEGKMAKRRRVGGRIVTTVAEDGEEDPHQQSAHTDDIDHMSDLFEEPVVTRPQVIKTDSEDSADSDMDWEEVDLRNHDTEKEDPEPEKGEVEELNLVLGTSDDNATQTPRSVKRKPISPVEKKFRLDIHKMHLCCLLVHVFLRNHWCDDEAVHTGLRGILSRKTISYLNPSEDKSQFQRSRSFMDGLEQASEAFRNRFNIVARGMNRPVWAESPQALARSQPPTDIDLPMMKADFQSAARDMKASRDVGAQLFCALLRSVGVDARLVCSLQALPFNHSPPAVSRSQMAYAAYNSAEQQERKGTPEADSDSDHRGEIEPESKATIGSLGGRTRFEPTVAETTDIQSSKLPMHSKQRFRESKYPVYWVEAFNEATQKWVPTDPLVTKTIAKPSKLEPPAGDGENNLTYVIAFEDDGSAHDVTRRYARAYNAKTRRNRVESTKTGDRWWNRVMKIYRRPHSLDRDQVDDAELAKKEAAEPMPRNIQDFRDHPYYSLERHLRRHEVVHPKREVGKVGAGRSGGSTKLEPIYRRRDVHNVLSADKWYRSMGREIKPGEQPLKRVPARRNREQSADPDEQGEENAGTALYAIHQTTPYMAPPVFNGRIPKNLYGNLDIYVPSMIPHGGIHIEHPETIRAARMLGIDFAEAVTGFVFKGRHGTAVTKGAVIANDNREAVEELISAFEDERIQAEEEQRSHEAMRMWKRFLAGLRIRERIEGYDIEGERDTVQEVRDKMDEVENEDEDEGDGFFPGQEAGDIAKPTAGRAFEENARIDTNQDEGGGFMVDNTENQAENAERHERDRLLDNIDEDGGGGFLVDDNHDEDAEQALQDSMEVDANAQTPFSSLVRPYVQSTLAAPVTLRQDAVNSRIDERLVKAISYTNGVEHAHTPSVSYLDSELTQEELDEARLLQELHEEKQNHCRSDSREETRASAPQPPQETHSDTSEAAKEYLKASPNVKQADLTSPVSPSTKAVSEVETPKSDKGSLLSEDPEDEDAEPDWLV